MRKRVGIAVLVAAVIGMTAGFPSLAMGQTEISAAQSQLVVTVEPGAHPAPLLKTNDIAVKLDNRPADVLNWRQRVNEPFEGRKPSIEVRTRPGIH